MNINATLIGQMITFALFVGITMKYIWPPLMRVMEERRGKIADGLAAAEQGKKELELARIKSEEQLMEAKAEAAHIIEQANRRANTIIEAAKGKAREEGDRLLSLARSEVQQEYNSAKEQLFAEVSQLAVAGAERILQREVERGGSSRLVDELVGEI